jgi:hypothetical protein
MTPGMVGFLPAWINYRPLSNFYNAIARAKPNIGGRQDYLHMGPVITVMVDIISDLA